jgi:hypothetical protein
MAVERVKVTGIKFFKGNIDLKDIDSGKVFIEESLDFTTGRAKGYATQEYSLGKSDLAQSLMHNHFPVLCDVEFMRVTNGDVSKNIVVSCIPVARGGDEKKAA